VSDTDDAPVDPFNTCTVGTQTGILELFSEEYGRCDGDRDTLLAYQAYDNLVFALGLYCRCTAHFEIEDGCIADCLSFYPEIDDVCNSDGSGCGLYFLQVLFDPSVLANEPALRGFGFDHTESFGMASVLVLLNSEISESTAPANNQVCNSCEIPITCDTSERRYVINCTNVLPDMQEGCDTCSLEYLVVASFEFLITIHDISGGSIAGVTTAATLMLSMVLAVLF